MCRECDETDGVAVYLDVGAFDELDKIAATNHRTPKEQVQYWIVRQSQLPIPLEKIAEAIQSQSSMQEAYLARIVDGIHGHPDQGGSAA